jgi:hypothetical protein
MDYNILYEEPPLIDYYVCAVGDNRYVYKGGAVVHEIRAARKFMNISSAHRYAKGAGITEYSLIGVKLHDMGGKTLMKLQYVKPRVKKTPSE